MTAGSEEKARFQARHHQVQSYPPWCTKLWRVKCTTINHLGRCTLAPAPASCLFKLSPTFLCRLSSGCLKQHPSCCPLFHQL